MLEYLEKEGVGGNVFRRTFSAAVVVSVALAVTLSSLRWSPTQLRSKVASFGFSGAGRWFEGIIDTHVRANVPARLMQSSATECERE